MARNKGPTPYLVAPPPPPPSLLRGLAPHAPTRPLHLTSLPLQIGFYITEAVRYEQLIFAPPPFPSFFFSFLSPLPSLHSLFFLSCLIPPLPFLHSLFSLLHPGQCRHCYMLFFDSLVSTWIFPHGRLVVSALDWTTGPLCF